MVKSLNKRTLLSFYPNQWDQPSSREMDNMFVLLQFEAALIF